MLSGCLGQIFEQSRTWPKMTPLGYFSDESIRGHTFPIHVDNSNLRFYSGVALLSSRRINFLPHTGKRAADGPTATKAASRSQRRLPSATDYEVCEGL